MCVPVADVHRPHFSVRWGEVATEREPHLETNVAALLTDRQYEVLEIAYRSGYFEKERRHDISEIVESRPFRAGRSPNTSGSHNESA